MEGLGGSTFVITGGASGIGRGTAARLVQAGSNVALLDRDAKALEVTRVALEADDRVTTFEVDVTDRTAVASAVDETLARFAALNGLVTSAGIFHPNDFTRVGEVDFDAFDEVLDVNLRGTLHAVAAVLPHLGNGASIVTIASTAGLRGHGYGPGYTATKGAVIALTRLVAIQYGPEGIRANCVCPGATAGEGLGAVFAEPATAERTSAGIPLRRVGTGADVGGTVAALLSGETSYLTGQVIAVDGGATAS